MNAPPRSLKPSPLIAAATAEQRSSFGGSDLALRAACDNLALPLPRITSVSVNGGCAQVSGKGIDCRFAAAATIDLPISQLRVQTIGRLLAEGADALKT